MLLLTLFAFLSGIVTILSPCILPILPIVLSGTFSTGKRKPWGIVLGFIASFTFFTLFLSAIVRLFGLPADILRSISIVVVVIFGIGLISPQLQILTEKLFSQFSSRFTPAKNGNGFTSGFILGLSLGLLWTPCVGPILASVITLAATASITIQTFFITFAYALGTAIPMFIIMYSGRTIFAKFPQLLLNTATIQKTFGVIMVIIGIALYFNFDRSFQTYILEKFPNYGVGLTKIEDNTISRRELEKLKAPTASATDLGSLQQKMFMPTAPELIAGGQWFNLPPDGAGSQPLTIASLKGKVILVDFWTYTCINCIRTLPYLKTWYQKYHDKGLEIIGVHTPEFEFEKNPDNVAKATKDFGLLYPIMQDNNYATWNAYQNHYWPAKYFIDKNGKIRFTHFGEGDYDESEKRLQILLAETGSEVANIPITNPVYTVKSQTPETYLGYARLGSFVSPEGIIQDKASLYSSPQNLRNPEFAYGGTWTVTKEQAKPAANATLTFAFNAQNVYLVMRSKTGEMGKISVYLDGQPITTAHSDSDVVNGLVTVTADRLYKLVKLDSAGEHILKLKFLDNNLELYAFTFG